MRIELGYLDDDGRVTYCETVAHAPAVRGILPNGSPHIPIYNIVLTYNCEQTRTEYIIENMNGSKSRMVKLHETKRVRRGNPEKSLYDPGSPTAASRPRRG